MPKRKWRALAAGLAATVLMTALAVPSFALENETDTIWGSVPASVYITREFYRNGNTITIPMDYLLSIEDDKPVTDIIKDAFWEAQRQSCYLFGDEGIRVEVGEDSVTIIRRSYYDSDTESEMRDATEKEAERILSEILYDGMSDYDKAVAIYQYVSRCSTYDWDAYNAIISEDCYGNIASWAKAISAYGVLIDGKSVCQGDAQAYTLLARKAGLTTMMATGIMPSGGGHAWNRVWCNSQWYEVDCCYEEFCLSFDIYAANTGVQYGGIGIMESSAGEFYGT